MGEFFWIGSNKIASPSELAGQTFYHTLKCLSPTIVGGSLRVSQKGNVFAQKAKNRRLRRLSSEAVYVSFLSISAAGQPQSSHVPNATARPPLRKRESTSRGCFQSFHLCPS